MEELGRGQLIVLLVVHIHRQSQVAALPLANHEAHVQFYPSRVRLLDHDTVEGLLPICKCWNVKESPDVFIHRYLTLPLLLGVRANRDPDQFIRMCWVPTAFRLICVIPGQIVPTSVSTAATAIHLEEAQDGRTEVHALVVQCRGRRVEVKIERIVIGTKNVQDRSHCRAHGVHGNVMDRLRFLVGTRVRIVDHDHHADFFADRLQGQSEKGKGETQNIIVIRII